MLLLKDFHLDVELPAKFLTPTLPLRLNYLLWIEDILETLNLKEDITGLDIGCGASCIYPLLASKHFGWKMIGSEINPESLEFAQKNVSKNQLESLVEIRLAQENSNFFSELPNLEFSMCNPPFFGSNDEMFQNRTGHRDPPSGVATGNSLEVVVEGGEVNFVCKMVEQSLECKEKVKVFTSMLGKKSSLTAVKEYLESKGIRNLISTEFCQGRTTRWGIAWTFLPGFYLNRVPQLVKTSGQRKVGHCVNFTFPSNDFDRIEENLDQIFATDLKLNVTVKEHEPNTAIWEIVATENTWSHQRRRKRLKLQQNG